MSHPSWVCGLKHNNSFWLQAVYRVTPFVGVWIETTSAVYRTELAVCHTLRGCVDWNFCKKTFGVIALSHTLRGCVDWNIILSYSFDESLVTPFVGVWIETRQAVCWMPWHLVTPFVGVWIETEYCCPDTKLGTSHPSWVCGLKLFREQSRRPWHQSHPSWVCGLKHAMRQPSLPTHLSHPSWVCGYKWMDKV